MDPDQFTQIEVTVSVPEAVIQEVEDELAAVDRQGDEKALEHRLADRINIQFSGVEALQE